MDNILYILFQLFCVLALSLGVGVLVAVLVHLVDSVLHGRLQ